MAATQHSKMGKTESKAQAEALSRVLTKLCAETKGILPKDSLAQMEEGLCGSSARAISRRVAVAVLQQPWPELAKVIASDRDAAIDISSAAALIDEHLEAYKELAHIMEAALWRLRIALAKREDMPKLSAEGARRLYEDTRRSGRQHREVAHA